MGNGQLSAIDYYFEIAFETTAKNMKDNGLEELIPLFVRTTAPLQLLILDARKHRGQYSASWQWFNKYGIQLKDQLGKVGWATGQVFLWDRFQGILVGIPECYGSITNKCVDLRALIESILDPRALGFGDCAFLGMISEGQEDINGGKKYTCPSKLCSDSENQAISNLQKGNQDSQSSIPTRTTQLGEEAKSFLGSIWSDMGESDFNTIDGLWQIF